MRMKMIGAIVIGVLVVIVGVGLLFSGNGQTPAQLPPEKYKRKLEGADSAIIIDVRTIWEYRNHRMEGAVNIPFPSFNYWRHTAQLDTTKTAFIYCHSAHRSPFVGRRLYKLGFDTVYDLKDGLQNWIKQGYTVEE